MKIQAIEARLERIEREGERLRKELADRRRKHFTALPAAHGMRSVDDLIDALLPYASRKYRPGKATSAPRTPQKPKAPVARAAGRPGGDQRRKYSDQQKAAVKAALQKGDKPVSQIAREMKVSAHTIIGWKDDWGLVKRRKKKAARK
jgi:transcriptional regulator with PAS, ATPase and Fis domain